MQEHELLEMDFAAAREVVANGEPWSSLGEDGLKHLAEQHAKLGDSRFRLLNELRAPRNEYERILFDTFHSHISDSESRSRLAAENERRVDCESMSALFASCDDKLLFYCRLMAVTCEIMAGLSTRRSLVEEFATLRRYSAEMNRKVSIPLRQFERLCHFIEECRIEQNLARPRTGEHESTCAVSLVLLVIRKAHFTWNACWERTDRSGYGMFLAIGYFFDNCAKSFPNGDDLRTLLSEEHALARVALRKRDMPGLPPQIVNHVHIAPTPISFSPVVNVQFPESAAKTGNDDQKLHQDSSVDGSGHVHPPHRPNLENWAVACELTGKWWLFHFRAGRLRPRKQLTIPAGNPRDLLNLFVEKEGHVTKQQLIEILRPKYRGCKPSDVMQAATDALAKVKGSIRTEIAVVSGCTPRDVANPLPHSKAVWRAAISLGYAVPDETNELVFKTHHEVDQG